MLRRGFLQMLGLSPVALMGEFIKTFPSESTMIEFDHNGWIIKWTPWIKPVNQRVLISHWVAINKDSRVGLCAYSSIPGAVNWYVSDQLFDTSIYEKDGQVLITPETSVKVAEQQKQLGLDRLIHFIDTAKKPYWV